MKRLLIASLLAGLFLLPSFVFGAAKGFFPCTCLIGGTSGCLDKISSTAGKVIDGTPYALETGDAAIVIVDGGAYFFRYDATSTASEDSTNYTVIKPDDLGGADPGRWIKKYHSTSWQTAPEITISAGVAALQGQGNYKITVESGDTDDLEKLTGLEDGHEVILAPTDGAKTVVVKDSTYLKLQNDADFELNNEYDRMRLLCIGSDTCVELSRMSGGN